MGFKTVFERKPVYIVRIDVGVKEDEVISQKKVEEDSDRISYVCLFPVFKTVPFLQSVEPDQA